MKLATKHADKAPVLGNFNALTMLVTPEMTERARLEREREEAEHLEREKHDSAYQAHCYRWLERIERWAMKQSRDELAERFPLALLLLIETRKSSRSRDELANKWKETSEKATERAVAMRAVAVDSIRKEQAQTAARRKGAINKLATDPKQAAKAGALELWKERDAGKHPNLRTVEQFATEVLYRWPVLQSSKVICGWSAKWSKQARAGEAPAC